MIRQAGAAFQCATCGDLIKINCTPSWQNEKSYAGTYDCARCVQEHAIVFSIDAPKNKLAEMRAHELAIKALA